jgi:hypothetical protein
MLIAAVKKTKRTGRAIIHDGRFGCPERCSAKQAGNSQGFRLSDDTNGILTLKP